MQKFSIAGMSCAACVSRVEKAVLSLDGVDSCSVNLLTNSMNVEGAASEKDIVFAVKKAGYGATPLGKAADSLNEENSAFIDNELRILKRRFFISLGFLIVLVYISMGGHIGLYLPPFLEENPLVFTLIQMILSSIILVINQKFFISGFKSIFKLSPNMDSLVAIGSGASFIYSTVILFIMCFNQSNHEYVHSLAHSELYFESASMILVLITVGKMLEAFSKGKTKNALKSLIKLKPTSAILLIDGKEAEVDIAKIKDGDIFIVKAGGTVPVDAIITEGEGSFDESALTGESVPSEKAVGDKIYASTIIKSGYIVAKATEVGEKTALSKIIKTVSDAVATKAPIAKIADSVSGFFVPVVILISIITIIIWLLCGADIGYSLARGISVLVISCPCALGLATPVAIMVGSGVGAKKGILFKDAGKLEACGKCDIILLDKTGTITSGAPEVTDIIPFNISEIELLKYAYSLEDKSEHPLALAITKKAKEESLAPLALEHFKTLSGSGVMGEINGDTLFGASYKYTTERLGENELLRSHFNALAEEGKTPLFFVKNDTPLGIIAVRDALKIGSEETISSLKEMGFYTVMLTGDNEKTARAVAREVGVDDVIASVLPDGKAEVVESMKRHGKVIMVGDGINDSPALARADVGIAIGNGTDIAIDTADVVLMKSNPKDICTAIKLSRATLTNIKQNLFWAFIYNGIGIPLAAGAFIYVSGGALTLSPMFGALAMSLSSFCVVTNALRLNLFREKKAYKRKKKALNIERVENKMEIELKVEGMMCPHCEARVKSVLEAIDGVAMASPSHKKSNVVIKLSKEVDSQLLISTIESQGYKASL
ncbi:MAG: heavy metal translocating P-type ATPase [Ruminococcaceae bacterium]|nr:heavy metal translocating P-type ATPase [Oscillospiraceae bacterium]